MAGLTPAEMAAARAFRSAQRAILERKAADITADVHVRYIRHDCAKRGGKSVSLELREHYVLSPAYDVNPGPEGIVVSVFPESAEPGEWDVIVPAKRFGWIFTEGRCAACGMTARSGSGRLVDPQTRPPADRSVVSGLPPVSPA